MSRRYNYSRLERTESRKNTRKSVLLIVASAVGLLVLATLGPAILYNISGALQSLRGSDTKVTIDDSTPPPPPRIVSPPDITNKNSFEVTGFAEPGSTVTINFRAKDIETLANSEGVFRTEVKLSKGENSFWAKATDTSGNESTRTREYKIIFDDEPPELEISDPTDGYTFVGSRSKTIVVKGSTESEATVRVNDRTAVVDSKGVFTLSYTLNDGDNNLEIVARDKASNETKKTITVAYQN